MSAGFFSKTLSTLLSTASRWVEFGDGLTAPVHGAVILDPATGKPMKLSQAFEERLNREGDPAYLTGSAGPVTVATGAVNTAIATAQGSGLVGKAYYLNEITVSLSSPANAQFQIAASADALFPGLLKNVIVGTAPLVVPVRQFIRGVTHSGNGNITLNIRNNLTAGSVDYHGTVSASGYRITDDFDFDAEKTVLWLMDSFGNGTGRTKTAAMWPFLFKKYLREQGIDSRVVLKAVSSAKSSDWSGFLEAGYANIQDADLIIYEPVVNDAGAAVADATYQGHLQRFWDWKRAQFPSATAIVCGCTPLENNTSETRAASLRTAASAFVTSIGNSKLRYINNGNRFDRTNTANFASSDPAGNRVHPSDAGDLQIASGGYSGDLGWNADYAALGISI